MAPLTACNLTRSFYGKTFANGGQGASILVISSRIELASPTKDTKLRGYLMRYHLVTGPSVNLCHQTMIQAGGSRGKYCAVASLMNLQKGDELFELGGGTKNHKDMQMACKRPNMTKLPSLLGSSCFEGAS